MQKGDLNLFAAGACLAAAVLSAAEGDGWFVLLHCIVASGNILCVIAARKVRP